MSFSIALSGLNAASSELSVTSNNIANVGTSGFKGSRAEFADVYSVNAGGMGTLQVAVWDDRLASGVDVVLLRDGEQVARRRVSSEASDEAVTAFDVFFDEADAGRTFTFRAEATDWQGERGTTDDQTVLVSVDDPPSWNRNHGVRNAVTIFGQLEPAADRFREIWERELLRARRLGCVSHRDMVETTMTRYVERYPDLGDARVFVRRMIDIVRAHNNPQNVAHQLSALAMLSTSNQAFAQAMDTYGMSSRSIAMGGAVTAAGVLADVLKIAQSLRGR